MSEEHESPEARRRRLASVDRARTISEETAQKLIHTIERADPIRRIRASQAATAIIGAIGFALFVVGVEQAAQDFPVIDNAYGSIAVGLVCLAITGALLRRLGGGD
jgi:hypothetical protein